MLRIMLLCLVLSGCAAMGGGPNSLTTDQLKALAADKNASAICSNVNGPWGSGRVVSVNVDKSSITNGTVSVNADCVVSISTSTPVKPEPTPVVKP